jgi:3-hydroxybutyryl-CoA dehydrogenase
MQMNAEDIRRVLVVGAGTMGQQIALQCAMHGCEVVVYDVSPEALARATARINDFAVQLVGQGRLPAEESEAAVARISFTTNPADAAAVDLLSESVPEDLDLKKRVFAQFNQVCPPHTIFTTDTSTLLPSMYAEATGRPRQFAAFHFHQAPHVWESNVVDNMTHPDTSPEITALLFAFAKRIGQIPIVLKKESPGYVFNAILGAMNDAAIKLLTTGVASVEDIDRAFMGVTKMPIGPFGGLDQVGLDTVWHIAQSKATLTGDPAAQQGADWFKNEYVDKGWLGIKSGRGFYTYPNPAYARPDFLTGSERQAEPG